MVFISVFLGLAAGFGEARLLRALYSAIIKNEKPNWWLLPLKLVIYGAFFAFCIIFDKAHLLISATAMVVCFLVFTVIGMKKLTSKAGGSKNDASSPDGDRK